MSPLLTMCPDGKLGPPRPKINRDMVRLGGVWEFCRTHRAWNARMPWHKDPGEHPCYPCWRAMHPEVAEGGRTRKTMREMQGTTRGQRSFGQRAKKGHTSGG